MRRLGPFTLGSPFATGGQGTVWSATHPSGAPVAIKVLLAERARDPAFLAEFEAEVAAVARLDHPHVVPVYDAGVVGEGIEGLVAGALWLAMEHVGGDTAASLIGGAPWPRLRSVLLAVLDSLAHAHARGLVHLDLKPHNVLLGPGVVKLADFGLARLRGRGAETGAEGGTPAYMAPEQIAEDWRLMGPWTDLYALGCMAWQLAAPEHPFAFATSPIQMCAAQLTKEPAPLHAVHPTPAGFEGWLRRLLRKDPRGRFHRASEASEALRALSGVPEAGALPRAARSIPPAMLSARTRVLEVPRAQLPRRAEDSAPPEPVVVPPMPTTWRRPEDFHRRLHLAGAGLGLFGVRDFGLVGREAERDALWEAARGCFTRGEPGAVVLRGPLGSGASRLARWLGELVGEWGLATVVSADHDAAESQASGLVSALRRGFVLHGDGDLEQLLRSPDWPQDSSAADRIALLGAVGEADPSADPTQTVLGRRLVGPRAARDRLTRALRHLATQRPVLCILDEVQWGWESIEQVRDLLARSQQDLPLLLVLAVDEDALEERRPESKALDKLAAQAGARVLELEPLSLTERRGLVEGTLGLSGDVALRVDERSGGNPGVAVELVRRLVESGALAPGPGGFELEPGAHLRLPDALAEVWLDRLRAAVGEDLRPWEIASILTMPVDDATWRTACATAGVEAPSVAPLLSAGLAVVAEGRWAFRHQALTSALRGAAADADRAAGWHRAVADAVPTDQRAVHLVDAGLLEEAAPALLEVVGRHLLGRRGEHTTPVLTAWHRLGLPADDPRHVGPLLLEAEHLRWRGDYPRSRACALRAGVLAEAADDGAARARSLALQARLDTMEGDGDGALHKASEAQVVAEAAGSLPMRGYALWLRGTILAQFHLDHEAGVALLQQFVSDERHAWLPEAMGAGYQALVQILGVAERFDEALHWAELAWDYCRERDHPQLMGHTANDRGRILWKTGDHAGAEASFRAAIEAYERDGRAAVGPLGNLAAMALEQGRPDVAEPLLGEVLEATRLGQPRWFAGAAFSMLCVCFALQGRWERYDGAFARLVEALDPDRCYQDDIAAAIERAGHLARTAGHPARARAAWTLAAARWRLRRREDDALRCEAHQGRP